MTQVDHPALCWYHSTAAQHVNKSSVFVSDASELEDLPEAGLVIIASQWLLYSSDSWGSAATDTDRNGVT